MKVFKELNISLDKRELISIVGGGGKTTTMFKLGDELLEKGKKVLITTTTAIFKPLRSSYEKLYLTHEVDYKTIKPSKTGITVMASYEIYDENKLKGLDSNLVDEIFKMNIFDVIIVEADGSNRKSIKAPAEHEPVIPSLTSKLVGIIGMDSVGEKIYQENVHRANIFIDTTNSKLGEIIDQNVIYNLVVSKQGIFKSAPINSEKYLILNKVETRERNLVSQQIKQRLLDSNADIRTIIGSVGRTAKVTGLVMASGFSRRMKTDKLLLRLGNKTVIERVLSSCKDSKLSEIIVVYRKDEIKEIAEQYELKLALNLSADKGQSQSIKVGLENIKWDTDGIMFIAGDHPFLDSDTIDKLMEEFQTNQDQIIVPTYNKTKGSPTIFPKTLKQELEQITGDTGGRQVIKENLKKVKYLEIENYKAGLDMDTVEEYEKFKEEFQ